MAFWKMVNEKTHEALKRADTDGGSVGSNAQVGTPWPTVIPLSGGNGGSAGSTGTTVKDYPQKNGFPTDDAADPEAKGFWEKVTDKSKEALATSKNNASGTSTAPKEFTYEGFTYNDYKESPVVSQAMAALEQHLAAKPGEYESAWQVYINGIIDRIMNREDFSYDVNSDALYQQYKDLYASLGKLAMQDAMGQAAGLTGGYGSSYASAAGNQAYQGYLSHLTDVVPELYGMARDQYNQEGQEMYNQYGMLVDQEIQDYARWVDAYNQWASERDHLQGVYNDERNFDYGAYSNDKSYAYSEHTQKQAYEQAKASGGAGGSSAGGSNAAALEHVASMSSAEIVETMQEYNYDEDNTGLAAFLDDCVASGRLTPEQADEYYAKFRTDKDDKDAVDTTVKPIVPNKTTGGGGGGRVENRLMN